MAVCKYRSCKQTITDSPVVCVGCFSSYHENCASRCSTEIEGIYTCCTRNSPSDIIPSLEALEEIDSDLSELEPLTGDLQVLQNNLLKQFRKDSYKVGKCLASITSILHSYKTKIDANASDIVDLRSDYDKLNDRLKTVEEKLESASSSSATGSGLPYNSNNLLSDGKAIGQLASEIKDRLHRSSNLLFYNVPTDKAHLDLDKIKVYLSKIPKIKSGSISVKRFPNPTVRSKVPPVLVRFSSNSEVHRVITNKNLLPKGIVVARDRTKSQRAHFKRLYEIVAKHNVDYPDQLKEVRYVNDDPVIVAASDSPTSLVDKPTGGSSCS